MSERRFRSGTRRLDCLPGRVLLVLCRLGDNTELLLLCQACFGCVDVLSCNLPELRRWKPMVTLVLQICDASVLLWPFDKYCCSVSRGLRWGESWRYTQKTCLFVSSSTRHEITHMTGHICITARINALAF